MKGFIDFVKEQGVAGLAVGFILGGAVSKVVSSFVTDIINPLLGLLLSSAKNLNTFVIKIGQAEILFGNFISVLIDFLIVSAVVYFIFKGLHLEKLDKKK